VRYERDGWIELVTREGYAELVTDRGSTIVRAGESAHSGSDRWGRVTVANAGPSDDLERWSDDLARGAQRAGKSSRYLDGQFGYASSQLDDNGDWVVYQNVNYWRPRVAAGWSPYWDGRWAWTPSGYTWVSNESWGWVPYHYGRWSMVPAYGWVWCPGTVYSPAWVYWHWSSGYAGWCPTGYYYDYYNPWYRGGFRYGFYGWAGGNWGYYSNWNFAPVHCFRDRNFRGQFRRGDDLKRERGWPEVPRGLITTDTRDFRPDRIDRADQLIHEIGKNRRGGNERELPDVTDFVGRKRDLAPPVARAIAPESPREPKIRFDEPKVASGPGWRDGGKGRGGSVPSDGGKVASGGRVPGGDVKGGRVPGGVDADRGSGVGADSKNWRGNAPVGSNDGKDRYGRNPGVGVDNPRVASPNPGSPGSKDGRGNAPGVSGAGKGGDDRISSSPAPRTGSDGKGGRVAAGDDRQGWKNDSGRGEGGSRSVVTTPGRGSNVSGGERLPGSGKPAAQDDRGRSSAPVERVISGTRKPVTPDSRTGAAGGGSVSDGRDSGRSNAAPGGKERYDSTDSSGSIRRSAPADAGRSTYRAPTAGTSRGDSGRSAVSPGGSTYRAAPPSGGSTSRVSPPSGGAQSRSTPPSGGSTVRSTPPPSGSQSSGSVRSGDSSAGSKSSAGSSRSSGSGSKSSGSGSKSSGSGSSKGSGNNGGKRDR
jgi:hypothetical protein